MLTTEEKTARRRAALRAEIVDRLLPIAEQLLEGEESYLAFKVERIIEQAGIARSTFYRYFNDKNELLIALSAPALADITAIGTRPWTRSDLDSRDDLASAVHETFEVFSRHATILSALVEVSAYDPAVKDAFLAGWNAARDRGAAAIEAGQASGHFRSDLHPRETASWFLWMAERGMYQLLPGATTEERRRLEESMTAIIWHTAIQQ